MTRRMTGLPSLSIHRSRLREKEEGGGGKPDDEDDDVGIDVEDDEDEEDEDEEDEDASKPFTKDDGTPFTKKDFDALNEALRKARREARAAKKKPADKGADEKITAEAKKWQGVVIKQSAKLALKEAGLQGAPDKLLKLLDMDDIEVDEDGDVDGLSEQIDELKKDYPELFAKKRRGIDAGDKDSRRGNEKLSPSEIQAKQMRGEL